MLTNFTIKNRLQRTKFKSNEPKIDPCNTPEKYFSTFTIFIIYFNSLFCLSKINHFQGILVKSISILLVNRNIDNQKLLIDLSINKFCIFHFYLNLSSNIQSLQINIVMNRDIVFNQTDALMEYLRKIGTLVDV